MMQVICLLSMQSGNDAITDVQWSPENGTLFAAATARGQVQLWDLEVSILAPVATCTLSGELHPTALQFLATSL
jgi:WD40 repeat protein